MPDATIVGHKCTFDGCIPHKAKVQKIHDWPECQNPTQVCGFLGVCSVLHIFIHDFASLTHPLVDLTKKGIPFDWGEPQQNTMQCLKDAICQSPALHRPDYESSRKVILAIDTSLIVVGYILLQEGDDGKHYPNHFDSIGLSNVESWYSSANHLVIVHSCTVLYSTVQWLQQSHASHKGPHLYSTVTVTAQHGTVCTLSPLHRCNNAISFFTVLFFFLY